MRESGDMEKLKVFLGKANNNQLAEARKIFYKTVLLPELQKIINKVNDETQGSCTNHWSKFLVTFIITGGLVALLHYAVPRSDDDDAQTAAAVVEYVCYFPAGTSFAALLILAVMKFWIKTQEGNISYRYDPNDVTFLGILDEFIQDVSQEEKEEKEKKEEKVEVFNVLTVAQAKENFGNHLRNLKNAMSRLNNLTQTSNESSGLLSYSQVSRVNNLSTWKGKVTRFFSDSLFCRRLSVFVAKLGESDLLAEKSLSIEMQNN